MQPLPTPPATHKTHPISPHPTHLIVLKVKLPPLSVPPRDVPPTGLGPARRTAPREPLAPRSQPQPRCARCHRGCGVWRCCRCRAGFEAFVRGGGGGRLRGGGGGSGGRCCCCCCCCCAGFQALGLGGGSSCCCCCCIVSTAAGAHRHSSLGGSLLAARGCSCCRQLLRVQALALAPAARARLLRQFAHVHLVVAGQAVIGIVWCEAVSGKGDLSYAGSLDRLSASGTTQNQSQPRPPQPQQDAPRPSQGRATAAGRWGSPRRSQSSVPGRRPCPWCRRAPRRQPSCQSRRLLRWCERWRGRGREDRGSSREGACCGVGGERGRAAACSASLPLRQCLRPTESTSCQTARTVYPLQQQQLFIRPPVRVHDGEAEVVDHAIPSCGVCACMYGMHTMGACAGRTKLVLGEAAAGGGSCEV